MIINGLQVIVTVFAVFALSRVFIAFRKGTLSIRELLMWVVIWAGVITVVYYPWITDRIFGFMGLDRGIDTLLYLSIVFLFYSLYRVYAKIERVEHEITRIVRDAAIKEGRRKAAQTRALKDSARQEGGKAG